MTHGGHGMRPIWHEVQVPKAALRRLWPKPLVAMPRSVDPPLAPDRDQLARERAYERPYWTYLQALSWVFLGDRAMVEDAGVAGDQLRHVAVIWAEAEYLGRARYPRLKLAEQALIDAHAAGDIRLLGRRNGLGDLVSIPQEQAADMEIYYATGHGHVATAKDVFKLATEWHDLHVARAEVLAHWPDPWAKPAAAEAAEAEPAAEDVPTEELGAGAPVTADQAEPKQQTGAAVATQDEVATFLKELSKRPKPPGQSAALTEFRETTGKTFNTESFRSFHRQIVGRQRRGRRPKID
jgi:hypothetical protein